MKITHNIHDAVSQLTNYVSSYPEDHYKNYDIETYLHDMLYGIGVSLSDDYSLYDGYEKFKKDLIEFLER